MEKSVRKIVSLLTRSDDETERLLSERAPLTAHDCYQAAVSHFRTHCFNWHTPTVSWAGQDRCGCTQTSMGRRALPCILTPKGRHCCPWNLVAGSAQAEHNGSPRPAAAGEEGGQTR